MSNFDVEDETDYPKNSFDWTSEKIVYLIFGVIWFILLLNISVVLDFFVYLTIQFFGSMMFILGIIFIIGLIWEMMFGWRRRRWWWWW